MRKIVRYIKIDSNIDKYMIKGISLMDIQIFVNELKISKEKIMIYQDIPQKSEKEQFPLNAVEYVDSINKRTNDFYTGNDCFIITNEKDIELLNKSCDDIFYLEENICIPEEVLMIFYVHDIDWLSIVIFNDKGLLMNFLDYINKHSKLVLESSVDVFYD